jgi:hypothetical protein
MGCAGARARTQWSAFHPRHEINRVQRLRRLPPNPSPRDGRPLNPLRTCTHLRPAGVRHGWSLDVATFLR